MEKKNLRRKKYDHRLNERNITWICLVNQSVRTFKILGSIFHLLTRRHSTHQGKRTKVSFRTSVFDEPCHPQVLLMGLGQLAPVLLVSLLAETLEAWIFGLEFALSDQIVGGRLGKFAKRYWLARSCASRSSSKALLCPEGRYG